jgi:hypothetical protein
METQTAVMHPGSVAEGPVLLPPAETKFLAPPKSDVTDKDFEDVVRGALEAVGGTLLFKIRIGADREGQHVAAAAVGDGATRQFLLLTLPTGGGQLRVETAARSASPLAKIAASYAGLMDVFKAAA